VPKQESRSFTHSFPNFASGNRPTSKMKLFLLLAVLVFVALSGAFRETSPSGPWDKLDVLLESAVASGTFPGCVGLIGTQEVRII
jgi:hypothetical protein